MSNESIRKKNSTDRRILFNSRNPFFEDFNFADSRVIRDDKPTSIIASQPLIIIKNPIRPNASAVKYDRYKGNIRSPIRAEYILPT